MKRQLHSRVILKKQLKTGETCFKRAVNLWSTNIRVNKLLKPTPFYVKRKIAFLFLFFNEMSITRNVTKCM